VISERMPGTRPDDTLHDAAHDAPDDAPHDAVPEPWRGEERLVREAILLVAAKGAPRVLVAGIAQGEVVLEHLRRPALEAGVRLLARATATGDRFDIVVEAIR
jgi:hypothetical protein